MAPSGTPLTRPAIELRGARDDGVFRPQIDGASGSNGFLAHRSIAEPGKSAVVVQQVRTFREQAALNHGGVKLPQLCVADQRAAGGDGCLCGTAAVCLALPAMVKVFSSTRRMKA